MEWDTPAPTITTQCFGYGNGRFGHPQQDRAITLREAAILQTFPDSYRFLRDGERVRFSVLGRLIGNAVPVRLGEVVAGSLLGHLRAVTKQSGGRAGRDHSLAPGSDPAAGTERIKARRLLSAPKRESGKATSNEKAAQKRRK
jgi:DNA (cytosine-5)-methyltransferase 1